MHGRGLRAAADVLKAGIASLRSDHAARLHEAASLTVAEHLLPGRLVVLASTHPDTAVSLTAGDSDATASAVLAIEADLGFIQGPDLPVGLSAQVVATDRPAGCRRRAEPPVDPPPPSWRRS